MATLILVVLPHIPRLPIWIPIAFAMLLGRRYLMTRNGFALPSTWMQFALTLLILLGLSLSYSTWLGRDASVALLVLLCGLKLLEMKSQRDALLLCFLSYFLIITHFLYSQSIPTALYMSVVIVVTTATLISLSDSNNRLKTHQRLRLSATLLIQALPVMLVLFILFPRVAGPFWTLPKGSHSGVTGLSNSLSLGNVSQLSRSDEIAFRVKFEGAIPPPDERYWRGPVLWWTNGRDWKTGYQKNKPIDQRNIQITDQPYDYTITLEPHHERWLFALDLPINTPPQAFMNSDYQLLAHKPIRQRLRYQLRSYTHYHAYAQTLSQYRLGLALPKGQHPRTRALAAQWQQKNSEPATIIQRALQYFNQEPFVYTYTPPLLLNDPVDEFLFKTRRGFCEHYAVAFTVLMRAAGIPARIVTGYLGGQLNPIGDYLIVRQRDAHAWSEVWLQNKGWVRIDPTSAVAPERVEQGIDAALLSEFDLFGFETNWHRDSAPVKMWEQIYNAWDAINNSWNQWVLGYNPAQQRQLLSQIGLEDIHWRDMTILLIVIISFFLLSYAAWMFLRPHYVRQDKAQQIYQRFCKKMARHGLPRHPSEGPLDYATRLSTAHPELATDIQQVIALYVQIRYRSQVQTLPQLYSAVQHFRL
jgi:transglutaminase-like putative cysteine protease